MTGAQSQFLKHSKGNETMVAPTKGGKVPPKSKNEVDAVLASAITVIGKDGEVLRRVKLLPYGTFRGRDGRGPWVLEDKAHAEAVIAATREFHGNTDMMFDYDHQSALAATPGVGGTARASGWIKLDTLAADEDGIYGDVDWTPSAEAALQAKEYRYHSPHFRHAKGDGRVTRIVNAGLTNSPNLDLPALASQQGGGSDDEEPLSSVGLAALASALSLPKNADEADVLAAIGALKSGAAPDPSRWVPKDGFDELKARVDHLDEATVLATVDQAVVSGRLTPAMRDWAINLGKKDMGELNSFLGVAPTFHGGPTVASKLAGDPNQLTEEERAVCTAMGWDEARFLNQKKQEVQ